MSSVKQIDLELLPVSGMTVDAEERETSVKDDDASGDSTCDNVSFRGVS